MDPASSERSRFRETMADVPQKPSEAIAAMDFFTVPTLTFGILYCFFVLDHDRRKITHFNVTVSALLFLTAIGKSNTVTKMSRKLRKTAANVKQMETNEGENGLRGFVPTC